MKALRFPVLALLAASVPLAAVGCYSGYDYATESSLKLSTGMSMEEVRAQLGDPSLIVRGDPGTETTWYYRYDGGPGTACIVFAVIFVILLIVVLVAAGGGGGSWGGGGGGGGDGPPAQIKLTFDPEGRLTDISQPEPVPGR